MMQTTPGRLLSALFFCMFLGVVAFGSLSPNREDLWESVWIAMCFVVKLPFTARAEFSWFFLLPLVLPAVFVLLLLSYRESAVMALPPSALSFALAVELAETVRQAHHSTLEGWSRYVDDMTYGVVAAMIVLIVASALAHSDAQQRIAARR